MVELRNIIFDTIKKLSQEKKEICLKKGIDFTGIYFVTILEHLQDIDSIGSVHKKSLIGRIKIFYDERKIKKALYALIKEGVVKKRHNGGITFMLTEDSERVRKSGSDLESGQN